MHAYLDNGRLFAPVTFISEDAYGDVWLEVPQDDPEYDTWLADARDEAPWAEVAAGWDDSKHPHVPAGSAKGGQWALKEDGSYGPVMGVGTPEQEAELRRKNAVPPVVEQQMEADLKDFLDNADLNMRMPEEALLEALDDNEFLNQHQANNSRGMGRTVESEARMFGLPEGTPPEGLAKYGYLGPDHGGVVSYGPIKVVFKDNVKDRATFTVNDSFMMGSGEVMPSPVRDPSYLSANLGQIDEAATAMLPEGMYDSTSVEPQGMNLRYGSEDFVANGDMWHDAIALEQTSIPYVEAQIYGKLTPADIDHVEVLAFDDWDLEDPVTGMPQVTDKETMQAAVDKLDALGIPWYEYSPPGDYSGQWA